MLPLITEKPVRTDAMAHYKYDETLDGRLTFMPKFSDEPVKLGIRQGNMLLVPRGICPVGHEDWRAFSKVPNPRNPLKPPINAEQKSVIVKSLSLLQQDRSHIVQAPTGFGKTYIGSTVAALLGQPTLFVVTKTDLMREWIRTLTTLVGIPESEIGIVQQKRKEWNKQFVVGMLHSLIIEDKYPPEMFKHFGLVVFDEVHRLGAETFSKACQLFSAKYRLGLSATPTRSDGKDKVFWSHIGPIDVVGYSIPMVPKVLIQKTGWKLPRRSVFNAEKGCYEEKVMPATPGRMANVFNIMAKNDSRNKIIAEFVQACFKKGRNTVVMSETLQHLEILFHVLARQGVPAEKIGYYVGSMSPAELDVGKKKPVVLATYAMCGEGTNVPQWDSLVMAVPRASVKQAVGRVTRAMPGKNEPVILDLVDFDSVFVNIGMSRLKDYYSIQAKVVNI